MIFVNFHRSRRERQRTARWQPLCYKQSPGFRQKFQKKSLHFCKNIKKNIVCKDYCIAHYDNETCSLPACKHHNILLGEIEEFLHKLDTFCFNYQQLDCLYTLFRYRFKGKIIAKGENVIDNVQWAVSFNQKNRGVDRMPSIAKKRLLRKKFKQHFMSALQKNNSTQTSGSVFAKKIEKAKKNEFELELRKIVGCFFDDHGRCDSSLASSKTNFFEQTIFFVTLCESNEYSQRKQITC